MEKDLKKNITIVVEGTAHDWPKDEITYEQVVKLEFPNYNSTVIYSVTYTRGHGNKPEGILSPGASVKTKDGMVFNVTDAGQS